MAKEKSGDKEARRKEKKERRSERDGVHKPKDKAAVEVVEAPDVTAKLLNDIDSTANGADTAVKAAAPLLALVPFANPLADEKTGKKVLRSVKKAAKAKALKRGVKEVVKALRKSSPTSANGAPSSVVVLAADISPMDVISHIPVLCEDHGVPYIFLPSRAELGAAGSTKRPTSVVMVARERGPAGKHRERAAEANGDGDADGADEDDFDEVFRELVKVVVRASKDVRV